MSVPAYNQGIGELQVFVRARKLLSFTIRLVRNEKHFRRRYHNDLGAPIIELARCMMRGVYTADGIDASTKEGLEIRGRLQQEVASACSNLQSEMLLALDFGLSTIKLREWTVLLTEFIEAFSKWRQSDKKKLLGR